MWDKDKTLEVPIRGLLYVKLKRHHDVPLYVLYLVFQPSTALYSFIKFSCVDVAGDLRVKEVQAILDGLVTEFSKRTIF